MQTVRAVKDTRGPSYLIPWPNLTLAYYVCFGGSNRRTMYATTAWIAERLTPSPSTTQYVFVHSRLPITVTR